MSGASSQFIRSSTPAGSSAGALPPEIRIVDLLRLREEAFLEVWRCETAVERILGQPYPFPDPPDLPSRRKSRTRKQGAGGTPPVRTLSTPEENAYRVILELAGQRKTTLTADANAVRSLLKTEMPELAVLRVETVRWLAPDDVVAVEVLWQRS